MFIKIEVPEGQTGRVSPFNGYRSNMGDGETLVNLDRVNLVRVVEKSLTMQGTQGYNFTIDFNTKDQAAAALTAIKNGITEGERLLTISRGVVRLDVE